MKHTFRAESTAPDDATHHFLIAAISQVRDCTVVDEGNPIVVERKRNVMRNRWAMPAKFTVDRGVITAEIEGAGNMQAAYFRDVLKGLPEDLIHDQGFGAAQSQMSKTERFFGGVELAMLRDELVPGERIQFMASCQHDKKASLIILTDRRLLMKDQGVTSSETLEIDPKLVTSLGLKAKATGEQVTFTASNVELELTGMQHGRGKELVDRLRDISRRKEPEPQLAGPGSHADELAKLAELHAAGVLTDEEFRAAKSRALGI